jgi:hypothetical protein
MNLKYGVVNLLLCLIILLLIFKNDEIWTSSRTPDKKEGVKKTESPAEPLPPLPVPQGSPLRESLMVITEKNIFHPDRKEFSLPAMEPAKPASRPPIQLFGVMIVNDLKTVSLTYPGKPVAKGERETKIMKIGDRVGDYQLTQVLPDRIILEAPGDTYEVLLYDPKSPKKRAVVKTPSKPAEITSALPIPAAHPASAGAAPAAPPIPGLPGPMQPSVEPKVSSAPPSSGSPAPIPDPSLLRGRRILRPGLPPGEGRN